MPIYNYYLWGQWLKVRSNTLVYWLIIIIVTGSVPVQLGWRLYHSSVVLPGQNRLVLWGGVQDGLPWVHDSEEKRSVTTKLSVLNLSSIQWNSVPTTGAPPAGAMYYSVTTIGEKVYLFDGGRCDGSCVHNDLYQLNTSNVWRCIPCTNRPMKKHSCGFISYSYQGSDYLLALGGEGGEQPPAEPQLQSLYTRNSDGYYTNEVHLMNVTASLGIVLYVCVSL